MKLTKCDVPSVQLVAVDCLWYVKFRLSVGDRSQKNSNFHSFLSAQSNGFKILVA